MAPSIPAAPKDFFYQRGRGTPLATSSDQQVRVLLRFAGRLELDRLQRAVDALVDEDPILRARFVEVGALDARWELDPGVGPPVCGLVETEARHEGAAAEDAFLSNLEIRDEGPYFQLQLVRTRADDSLCMRVDHRLGDAGGTRLLVRRLVDRYRRLASGLPLPPRLADFTPRTIAGLAGPGPGPASPAPAHAPRPRGPTYSLPRVGEANQRPRLSRRILATGPVEAIRRRARALGATLNDAILVALIRALQPFALVPSGERLFLQVSADARSRLPKSAPESICNLFVAMFPELRHEPTRSFAEAMATTAVATAQARAALTLEELRTGEAAFEAMIRRWIEEFGWPNPPPGKATHIILSNLGVLDETALDPGGPAIAHAEMLGTIALGRQLLVAASTFRGVLTLSTGYCVSDVEPAIVEGVLDRMASELAAFAEGA